MYTYVGSFQAVQLIFSLTGSRVGCFLYPGIIVSMGGADPSASAKLFFMASGYCLVLPDSVPHNLRLLPHKNDLSYDIVRSNAEMG